MKPQAFIFIGRSGCGKGTQVKLLMEILAQKDPSLESLYVQTGQEFRQFIQGETFTQKKSKEIYDAGGLQPEFLTVDMWGRVLIEKYKGDQHLIFDGTPRKLHEAGALHSCFGFYGFDKPWVINIDISNAESKKRLLARKRFDDTEEEITKRLEWYETDVEPALGYYDGNPKYTFLKISGERSVEEIHADIVKRLGLV
ncbi:MAG: nucleoside monophosphate kinase [Candidatus Taylorbacteria bacterium]